MSNAVEVFLRLSEAKSANLNITINSSKNTSTLKAHELICLLDMESSAYALGMLVVKASYRLNDICSINKLISYIESQCNSFNAMEKEAVISIVLAMVINKPLKSQYKKVASLYKQYDGKALLLRNDIAKNVKKLKALYGMPATRNNQFYIEQAEQALSHANKKLDQYLDEKATTTIVCPKCHASGCEVCSNGLVKPMIPDVKKEFEMMGIDFDKSRFITQYWAPMLSIASKLEIHKLEAIAEMKSRLKQLKYS